MGTRLELHAKLVNLLKMPYVYFRAPSEDRMYYPCFRYDLTEIHTKHADNKVYMSKKGYLVTYITDLPDDDMSKQLFETFDNIRFDRSYIADGLNHFVYKIFY